MGENSAWKTRLRHWHSELRTGIIVQNVLPDLRPLLTPVEYANVDDSKGNVDAVNALVGILLTKDESIFDGFCSALEKNGYPFWASKLRGEGI